MKRPVPAALAALLLLTLPVFAACGGGGDEEVPGDAIAVVDGADVDKAEYDALLDQAERSYKLQKRPFPKAGTPEFTTLKNQAVAFLVQRTQFERKAEERRHRGHREAGRRQAQGDQKQYFNNDQKKYEAQLKQQGLTEEQVRRDVRAQLIQEGLFKKITGDVKVDDKAISDYYAKNKAQYTQPSSREVRDILVKTKKQADTIYAQFKDGGNFAALAKKHSQTRPRRLRAAS